LPEEKISYPHENCDRFISEADFKPISKKDSRHGASKKPPLTSASPLYDIMLIEQAPKNFVNW